MVLHRFMAFEIVSKEVADFRQALAEATGQPGLGYYYRQGEMFVQHVNLWQVHEGVRRYVFDPRLAEIARQLAQVPRVRLWHDQLIIKMPGQESTWWHQDLPLWPMIEAGALTCWLALVDVTVEMGAMHFILGSHRWGRLAITSLPHEILYDLEGLRYLVPEDKQDLLKPVVYELKAGDCTFHNALTLHWTRPNTTDQVRLGFIINYFPDGVRYSGRKHVITDDLGLAVGQPIAGERFPILAENAEAVTRI